MPTGTFFFAGPVLADVASGFDTGNAPPSSDAQEESESVIVFLTLGCFDAASWSEDEFLSSFSWLEPQKEICVQMDRILGFYTTFIRRVDF